MAHAQQNAALNDSLRNAIKITQGREKFLLQLQIISDVNLPDFAHGDSVLIAARSWAENQGDSNDLLQCELAEAKLLNDKGNTGEGLKLGLKIDNSPYASSELKAETKLFLRNIYFDLGSFEQALEYHRKIDWKLLPKHWESKAPFSFLAFLFSKLEDYEKAISYMSESVQLMKKNRLPYWQLSYTNSLGFMYEQSGNLDSAWVNYKRALQLLETNFTIHDNIDSMSYRFIEGLIFGNMAQVMAKQGNHLQAIPLYKRDIECSMLEPMTLESRKNAIISTIKISDSYLATNQLAFAQSSLGKAKSMLEHNAFAEEWLSYWKSAWNYYENIGKTDSALFCANKYVAANDSLEFILNRKRAQDLVIAYESTLREQQLRDQEAMMRELEEKAAEEKYTLRFAIIAIILLVMALIASYIIYRSRLSREKALREKSAQIEEQQVLIEDSLKEKDALIREVHHRVKNNLQIISSLFYLQAKKIKDPAALEAIKEGQLRVQIMSVIHQKLYQNEQLDLINFRLYISELAEQILESQKRSDLNVKLNIQADSVPISVDKAVPIGLIVNELITNSLKHGFEGLYSGTINIRIYLNENIAHLVYMDDGNGVTDIENLEKGNTLGMRLIRLFTNQLDGKMDIHSEKGIVFDFQFPIDRK